MEGIVSISTWSYGRERFITSVDPFILAPSSLEHLEGNERRLRLFGYSLSHQPQLRYPLISLVNEEKGGMANGILLFPLTLQPFYRSVYVPTQVAIDGRGCTSIG